MSHTPAPWHGPVNNASRFEIQGGGRRVALVDRIEDARLISAAPDLLEALQSVKADIEDLIANDGISPLHRETTLKAQAAIAKAVQP
jgi:hypothetical protein